MTQARESAEFFTTIQVGASQSPNSTAPTPTLDPDSAALLRTLVDQNRELILLGRRQYEIAQRMEERYEKQLQAQRDEFVRWLQDIPGLSQRGKEASEAVRMLLGKLIDDFVMYVDENREGLEDSEFVRSEMVDKYGQMLNHISSMYGMLKRLSTADES